MIILSSVSLSDLILVEYTSFHVFLLISWKRMFIVFFTLQHRTITIIKKKKRNAECLFMHMVATSRESWLTDASDASGSKGLEDEMRSYNWHSDYKHRRRHDRVVASLRDR